MIFVCNTSYCHNHLCHIIYKSDFTEIYAQSLIAYCDIDLRSRDMVLVHDTLVCHDDRLYHNNLKS